MAWNELAAETRTRANGKPNPFASYFKSAWPAYISLIIGLVLVATAEPSEELKTSQAEVAHASEPRESADPTGQVGEQPSATNRTATSDADKANLKAVGAGSNRSPIGALETFLLRHHIIQKLWKELGFAMIISSLTWLIFDFTLRARAEDENEKRLDRISKNVLHAVLGQRIGQELVEEIEAVNFRVDFIRPLMIANYTIRDACYQGVGGIKSYVELQSSVSFVVQNVTMGPCKFKVGTHLPDPMHPKLREITRVKSITAKREGQRKNEKFDLPAAENEFRDQMKLETKAQIPFIAGEVELAPNEKLSVKIVSILAKEEEDSEFLEMGYPTEHLTVTVNDHADGDRRKIRARTIHRDPVSAVSERGELNIDVELWTLRHQGVYFWWKRVENGGDQPTAPASKAQSRKSTNMVDLETSTGSSRSAGKKSVKPPGEQPDI